MLPHIERWLAHDDSWSSQGVKDELERGHAQLFCLHNLDIKGIWITRVHDNGHRKVGVVWGCAGDMNEVRSEALEFFAVIEAWMREIGCDFVEIVGRRGWERIFPDYERFAVILRKRL